MIVTQQVYDGSILDRRFGYRFAKDQISPYGEVIIFVAPIQTNTQIKSAINICYQLPTGDLWGGIAFQRLYHASLGDIIANIEQAPVEIFEDAIIINKEFTQNGIQHLRGRVNLATIRLISGGVVGHVGIVLETGDKAPAPLYAMQFDNNGINTFVKEAEDRFHQLVKSIYIATEKNTW